MTFRRICLFISKYLAISLCLVTILLTTPWGTQLTLILANNINGVTFDYRSGSLVRDIELNVFNLKLDNLDISVKGLSTEIDFSCAWKKTLCIKSAEADYFSLRYLKDNRETTQNSSKITNRHQRFEMPFSIAADSIRIKESHLEINNIEISIEQFLTQLSINKNDFSFSDTASKQLTLVLEKIEQDITMQDKSIAHRVNQSAVTLPEISLPIALIINKLHIDSVEVVTKDEQNIHDQQWRSSNNKLSGSWHDTDVSISQFQTTTTSFAIKALTGDAKLKPPYQLNTQLVSQLEDVPWWPEIANTSQQLSMQGTLEDLAFDLSSKGNLALKSQGKINLINEGMPFSIKLQADKIPTPSTLSEYGNYSSLSLLLVGDMKQQTIDLSSKINGYGYNNAQLKLSVNHQDQHFTFDKFAFEDKDSNSQLNIDGDITIFPNDIAWQLSANSTGFTLPQISLQSLTDLVNNIEQFDELIEISPALNQGRLEGNITSNGTWSDSAWTVAFTDTELAGDINDLALNIKADIGFTHLGHFRPGKLYIDFNNSALTLHSANNGFWDIKGQLRVDNINQWYHGINGGFISNFSVSGEQNNPIFKLKTQLSELNWQHWQSNFLDIEVNYKPMSNHQIQFTLNNDQLHWRKKDKHHSVDNLLITVQGDATDHQVAAHWLGNFYGELTLTGQWNDDFSQWQSSIEKSALSFKKITLTNDNVFNLEVDISKQEAVIEDHCWHGTGLAICLANNTTVGASGDLAMNWNIDLSEVDELFLPKDTEIISQIDGDINVKWSPDKAIEATADFSLSSGYLNVIDDFNEHKLSQWSQGLFSFTVNEKHLLNKLLLTDINDLPLVDITSKIDFIDDWSVRKSPISSKVILNKINLQPFQSILTDVITLQGKVTADISVDGTIGSPITNGDISLEQGKIRIRKNANTLENISSSISIKDNQAVMNGRLFIEGNEAKLQGNMSWRDSLTMNIDLTADALPLVFPPQLIMTVAPSLNFNLVERALNISGNIDVLDGIYNIEKLSDSSVSLSDDVIILDNQGKAMIKETAGFDIKTNINVNIDQAFEISGQGLQGHLFGQLQIKQQEKHPFQMFGRVQSTKGTFQAYGQRLNIDKGELSFNGPIDNPYFNLRASRHIKAEDIDVGITVTGLSDALDIQLFSSPNMEMPEMLSYLVRGRSLDAGTENSTAAASFLVGFGATNSAGLFDRIEEIPLISNIAVDTEGEGEKTQATVSGYIGNRVYLKYGIGVYEPINELTVRMFILNRFWLEIVSGIEQSTDIYYSFYID